MFRGEERLGDEPRIQRVAIDEHDGASHGGHITSQRLPMRPSSSSDRSPRSISSRTISSHSDAVEVPQAAELGQRQSHAGHLAVLAGDGTEQVIARGSRAWWRAMARETAPIVEILSMGEARRSSHASITALQRLCHYRCGAQHGRSVSRTGVTSAEFFAAIGSFLPRPPPERGDRAAAIGAERARVVHSRAAGGAHHVPLPYHRRRRSTSATPRPMRWSPRWRWRPPKSAAISTCCTSSPARCRRSGRMSRRRWICAPSSRRGPTPRSSS